MGESQVQPQFQNLLGSELPAWLDELHFAITGQVANAVLVQSGVVVGLGVVAFGVGLALHFGVVELPSGSDGA